MLHVHPLNLVGGDSARVSQLRALGAALHDLLQCDVAPVQRPGQESFGALLTSVEHAYNDTLGAVVSDLDT